MKKVDVLGNLVLGLYLSGAFLTMISDISRMILALVGILAVLIIVKYMDLKDNITIVPYVLFQILSAFICTSYSNNMNISAIIYSIINLIIVFLMFNIEISVLTPWCLMATYSIYFFMVWLSNRGAHASFIGYSENYISIVMLIVVCVYFIACDENNKRPNIFFVIPGLIFSIWAGGRGGILVFGILAIGMLVLDIFYNHLLGIQDMTWARVIAIIMLLLLIGWVSGFLQYTINILMKMGLYDAPRMRIWGYYFGILRRKPLGILLGGEIQSQPLLFNWVGKNLHNSFLNIQAKYGLAFAIVSIFFLIRTIFYYIKERKFYMLLIASAFCLRAFTDLVFCNFWGEIIFYYFVLYIFSSKTRNDSERKSIRREADYGTI
ncbi:MAG: hypothetical protein HDR00_15690 [Lachnospiraceae bacterium]|nr:hypothetical protein [Lachnospiraceae bacterium]